MMRPNEFIKTLYLGDRSCKAIYVDSWQKRVAVQVDLISRLKPGTDTWDFYAAGDIQDGLLVFTDAWLLKLEPSGPLPNDLINDFSVEADAETPERVGYLFKFSIGSVDEKGQTIEVAVTIRAKNVHLEDPKAPGVVIS